MFGVVAHGDDALVVGADVDLVRVGLDALDVAVDLRPVRAPTDVAATQQAAAAAGQRGQHQQGEEHGDGGGEMAQRRRERRRAERDGAVPRCCTGGLGIGGVFMSGSFLVVQRLGL